MSLAEDRVYRHSFISKEQKWPLNNPTKNVWLISGSENHCAAQRSANLLSLQVLLKAGAPYGADTLGAGHQQPRGLRAMGIYRDYRSVGCDGVPYE